MLFDSPAFGDVDYYEDYEGYDHKGYQGTNEMSNAKWSGYDGFPFDACMQSRTTKSHSN